MTILPRDMLITEVRARPASNMCFQGFNAEACEDRIRYQIAVMKKEAAKVTLDLDLKRTG